MAVSQNTFSEYLWDGLRGRNFKATLILYLLNALLLCLVGYLMIRIYGEDKSIDLLPVVVVFIIVFEYGACFILSPLSKLHAKSYSATKKLIRQLSTSTMHSFERNIGLNYKLSNKQVARKWNGVTRISRLQADLDFQLEREKNLLKEGEGFLTIEIQTTRNITRPKLKIKSLNNLLDELVELIGIPNGLSFLKLISFKPSSLEIGIVAPLNIITLMASIIEFVVVSLHKTSVRKDQITNREHSKKALESMLKLEKRLEEAGIHTNDIKGNIQTASTNIAMHLSRLLLNTSNIEVNKITALSNVKELKLGEKQKNMLTETSKEQLTGGAHFKSKKSVARKMAARRKNLTKSKKKH